MDPKVFILDDHSQYRSLLSHHITTRWPKAKIIEYDPVAAGRLPENFSGAGCDVVLLGDPAGKIDALQWLEQFCKLPRFPAVIVLGSGDEQHIVATIKAGADNYISKRRLNHNRLIEIIDSAVESRKKESSSGSVFGEVQESGGVILPSLKGYHLERCLASGTSSTVYLTLEQASGEQRVLKVLHRLPDSDAGEVTFDRFLQEFELVGRIKHNNIVTIYDLGIADDHAYIAMEYCGHGSLKRRIMAGIDPEGATRFMRQIAGALGAIHEVGILHRDLKPTNVMFRLDETLALIDFGLAKLAHLQAELTGTGEIFGTPYYMSPEQGHGGVADTRSDIYSLGIMYYEMLVGEKPYDGDTAMAVIIKHKGAPIPRLPAAIAQYQPAIDKMMAKRPEDRFQSVAELLNWQPEACS